MWGGGGRRQTGGERRHRLRTVAELAVCSLARWCDTIGRCIYYPMGHPLMRLQYLGELKIIRARCFPPGYPSRSEASELSVMTFVIGATVWTPCFVEAMRLFLGSARGCAILPRGTAARAGFGYLSCDVISPAVSGRGGECAHRSS